MWTISWSLPFGLSIAATVRCGNLFGEKKYSECRFAANTSIIVGAVMQLCMGSIILACQSVLGRAFTSSEEVVELVRELTIFLAAVQVLDGTMTVIGGVMRGLGKQPVAAVVDLLGFYAVGLVCAYGAVSQRLFMLDYCAYFRGLRAKPELCFQYGWGLKGLWVGQNIGLFVIVIFFVIYMKFFIVFGEPRVVGVASFFLVDLGCLAKCIVGDLQRPGRVSKRVAPVPDDGTLKGSGTPKEGWTDIEHAPAPSAIVGGSN